jgi:hypothetical protein
MKTLIISTDYGKATTSALTSNADGIVINIPAVNFMGVTDFYRPKLNELVSDIKKHYSYGKTSAISIRFGKDAGAWNRYPYLTITESHHQGQGVPEPMKQPIFYDPKYQQHLKDFWQWLFEGLLPVWHMIEYFKITGINQKTSEFRVFDQTFENTNDINEAYEHGAEKWLGAGYTISICLQACKALIDIFNGIDKPVIMAFISGLAGFPCIIGNSICKPNKRHKITDILINYGYSNPSFGTMYTALKTGGTIPSIMGSNPSFQLSETVWGKAGKTKTEFEAVKSYAESFGAKYLEIFNGNLNLL